MHNLLQFRIIRIINQNNDQALGLSFFQIANRLVDLTLLLQPLSIRENILSTNSIQLRHMLFVF